MRKLPKTMKFLNNFSKYETNPSKKNNTVFQFFKYNSLNTYTEPNLRAIYYGVTFKENGTHFGNYLKKMVILQEESIHIVKKSLLMVMMVLLHSVILFLIMKAFLLDV